MGLFKRIARRYPNLKKKLRMARLQKTPEQYLKEKILGALMLSLFLTIGVYMLSTALDFTPWSALLTFIVTFFLLYQFLIRTVDVKIKKLAKEIDREVLFAGRYLLVKLHSGKPLMNALNEASKSYGIANQQFKRIVKDIELGTPIEEALAKASRYSPSEKMRRILFQISNSLKIGVDVTNFLESILEEIAEEQLIEIQSYGKKLSSVTMFYMLLAIIVPSLGITIFITVISLINIQIDMTLFSVIVFILAVLQFIFITVFKAIRPNVNI